ncbi:hypothetical protein WDU94_015591, partial [Cyamophila willieti]
VASVNRKSLVTTNHHDPGTSYGRPPFNPSYGRPPFNPSSGRPPFNSSLAPDKRSSVFKCSVCNGSGHRIASCAKFLKMDPTQRIKQVRELKLCLACLSSTHFLPDCKSTYQCKFCRSTAHHSLLHDSDQPSKSFNNSTALPAARAACHATNQVNISSSVVLLGTAIVQLQDKYGVWHPVRCILDSGSQISIMTQRLAYQLKLPWHSTSIQVSGVGGNNPVQGKGEVNVKLLPHQHVVKPGMQPLNVQAVILPTISNNLASPAFLKQPIEDWPRSSIDVPDQVPELKPTTSLVTNADVNPLIQTVERFSSLCKLQRVFAYVLRFINGCRKRRSSVISLSLAELDRALKTVIHITQMCHLQEDLKAVKKGQPVANHLRSLSPLITSAGILAVGGRLSQAPIPEEAKHPILLPCKAHLTKLLIHHYHDITLHGGPKVVQSLIQRSFWIVGARSLIRNLLSKCVKCFHTRPFFRQPIMADLPASRFAQGRAFLNVGVDLAGPFSLKSGPRRNSPIVKAYFAIFVCMSVKAIHLELLSSLSTPCFLAALDRFIGRRGLPSVIHSDNGTNFRGAARHISETQQFLSTSHDEISSHLRDREVSWTHIASRSPWIGGIWEAGVKSVKKHLKHVLHNHSFNYEEFLTILISCEAICNSRPLCAVGVNPNDGVDVLTPGHFLTGAPLLARAEIDVSDTYIPPVKRWLLITQASQSFWKRWKADYLNTLIQRGKWTSGAENIKVGDIVIIRGADSPPQQWPLGRVTEVLPGHDGVVRVTKVKTSTGELTRPAAKLAVVPVGASHN